MSLRPTRQILTLSVKLFACGAALIFAVSCASTQEEDDSADTGSEFQQGDQDEVAIPDETVADTTVSATTMNLETIYFDFDQSAIRSNVRPLLRENGQQLQASGTSVRLEGHCDQRGDEEYNLALGERRATAVKRYLENLGVPRQNMRTVSYGEAKPAAQGNDESAWRYNRRVEFKQ